MTRRYTRSPASRSAAARNLIKARAAQKGRPRSAAQQAASRGNLIKARAARSHGGGMIQAEDGSWVRASFYGRSARSSSAGHRGKIQAEDGSWVNASFYGGKKPRSARQASASRANLARARAAQRGKPRSAAQKAAALSNLSHAWHKPRTAAQKAAARNTLVAARHHHHRGNHNPRKPYHLKQKRHGR